MDCFFKNMLCISSNVLIPQFLNVDSLLENYLKLLWIHQNSKFLVLFSFHENGIIFGMYLPLKIVFTVQLFIYFEQLSRSNTKLLWLIQMFSHLWFI